ncbi:nitric oxide-associated protein 1 [Periplaneta americana]|uniref:nitric oxide-associated protein 1 n=1 Tax=Periplaneta americana TaxID=6978 RepID=UPI0037E98BB3
MVCQRCHFMRFYDTALNVIVSPDDYPKLMAHLKHKVALILLLVDLLDFPCSIWPGIMDIIGHKQPIVIVANKVDLLPPDSRGFLHRIQKCLAENLTSSGIPTKNIKHIALISAKTGYGVEELITKLHNIWGYKGDVYLLGSTNVGKSTLFNALLQSDYCKVKAVDLIQRATTSPWPGTTINLLKFPILRPSGWQLYERTKRIISTRQQVEAQRRLHNLQLKENNAKNLPSLIGHIGMTFYTKTPAVNADPFSIERKVENPRVLCGLDPADETYAKSKWCYDTPGAVHPDQVIHLLTTEELMMTLPKKLVQPRTFRVSPNMSLFIAGLGRLDYVEGDGPIRMTVFSSSSLPLTICQIDDAAEIYDALLGSKLLGVPCGGSSRLSQWPGLKVHSRDFELQGCGWKESCGDILLSSAGWIAITAGKDKRCRFQAWTPGGVGVHLRCPPLLPFAVNLCGSKVRRSPAYRKGKGVYLK